MPGKAINNVVKNKFFTYFEVDGKTTKYREKNEIWTFEGVSMKFQGDMVGSPGGDFNSFGKKHLLSIEGGKSATALEKATKLLAKRGAGKAAMAAGRNAKDVQIRKDIGGDKKQAVASAKDHFEASAYGKQKTETNTVIMLDEFASKDEAAKCFKDPIAAITDWATNPKQDVAVTLLPDSVLTLGTDGTETYTDTVHVTVWFNAGLYHVYHLDA